MMHVQPPDPVKTGVLLLLAVCRLSVSALAETPDAWDEAFILNESRANLELACAQPDAGAFRLRLAESGSVHFLELGLQASESSATASSPDAFPTGWEEKIRLFPVPQPETDLDWRILTVKRRPRGWSLYLDLQPVAHFPEYFDGPVSISLAKSLTAIPEDAPKPFLQRIGTVAFEDAFMVPPDTEDGLVNWEILQGDWGLHVIERSDVQQRQGGARVPTAERSPNFYSLHGTGDRAMIVTGTEFDDHYHYRAAVQHTSGTNGIVFMHPFESNDFHALTTETDPVSQRVQLALWRGDLESSGREVLAAFQTDRLPGQWLLLETQLFDDQIVLRLNHQAFAVMPVSLPPGGRFGLYADNDSGARFDDVWARTHHDVPLNDARNWLRNTTLEAGTIAPAADSTGSPSQAALDVRDGTPARARFGTPEDAPRRLSLDVWLPQDAPANVGLELGDPDNPSGRWSLHINQTSDPEWEIELHVETNGTRRLHDRFSLPAPAQRAPVRLTLDATRAREIRGLINDRLVVVEAPIEPVTGTAGLFATPKVGLGWPVMSGFPLVFTDQVEENPQYVEDRFMRHWASPEGQWVTFPDGLTWHRGDAFQGVSITLPVKSPSELHLAVPSGETNGLVRLITRDGVSRLMAATNGPAVGTVAEWPLTQVSRRVLGDLGEQPVLTVRLDGHCLWVTSGKSLLWRGHLTDPASTRGTRMRLQGLDVPDLHHVQVRRDAVLDVLFTDSPFDWTLHGGQWEVVNRFACEPTWSHMGGENPDGLAALWSNFRFSGDFCLEMFAGARHGWYERVGDLNLTVMNQRPTPGDGYTTIATGWDPDWSQEFTRLFQQGNLRHVSTRYVAPRRREGNRRQGYEPLLASGRDVHGAWYSLRLRRVDGRLVYSFDNETVFDLPDETPLTDGGMGIWTYRNSIMVARVRLAAESIHPNPAAIEPIPVDEYRRGSTPETPPARFADARHAVTLNSKLWQAAPCPARIALRILEVDAEPVLLVQSAQAGGQLHAKPDLPVMPTAQLAGWRFEMARKPETRINAAMTFGNAGENATLADALPVEFQLSGTDNDRGPRRILAGTEIPVSETDDFPRHANWTPVTLWLPLDLVNTYSHVRFDGFGNLQPSDLQQGLDGNPPGAAYAIRRLEPLWYNASPDGHALDRIGEVVAAPKPEDWHVRWSDNRPHVLEIGTLDALPPRLPEPTVAVNGHPVPAAVDGSSWFVPLPLPFPESPVASLKVQFSLGQNLAVEQTLSLPDPPDAHPPVLTSLALPGIFRDFRHADKADDGNIAMGNTHESIRFDAQSGEYRLRLANAGAEARLAGSLLTGADLVANPLIAFHYRADPLARVSLELPVFGLIPFSEPRPNVDALPGQLDGDWHRFQTPVSDWLGRYTIAQARQLTAAQVRIRSTHSVDRTGRYAWIDFRKLALGPAVGPQRPLTVTPVYNAIDGVERLELSLVANTTITDPEPEADLAWLAISNAIPHTVDLTDQPDGPGVLLLRAVGKRGAASTTTRIPFLLDSRADPVQLALGQTPEQGPGTRLNAQIDPNGGSPIRVNPLALTCDAQSIELDPAFTHVQFRPGRTEITFDLPPLLRDHLDRASDGQVLTLIVDGLRDGADNVIPAAEITYTVDYATDSTPPTLRTVETGNSPLFWTGLLGPAGSGFAQAQHAQQRIETTDDGTRYLDLHFRNPRGLFSQPIGDKPWDLDTHPWLAVSIALPEALEGDTAAPAILELIATEKVFPSRNQKINRLRIPLDPGRDRLTRHVKGAMQWEPGQWNDLIINVRDLVRRSAETDATPKIQTLTLRTPRDNQARLHLRTLAILGSWEPDHRLDIDAYDASGIKELNWQDGSQTERTIFPSKLELPDTDRLWLRLQIVDFPGNATPPLLIPIPNPPAAVTDPKPETETDEKPQQDEDEEDDE